MQGNFPKIPFFSSLIVFVFSCALFFFAYRAINNNNKELRLSEGQWQAEAQRRDEIRAIDQSVKVIESERVQLETHFAQSSDIVPFLDTIEKLGPATGTKAEVISVGILADHSGLLVGLKTSGTFSGFDKFLMLLENSPYELEFITMDVQREAGLDATGKNTGPATWNAVFKLKLLSFIE
jgi:hypothetical protein